MHPQLELQSICPFFLLSQLQLGKNPVTILILRSLILKYYSLISLSNCFVFFLMLSSICYFDTIFKSFQWGHWSIANELKRPSIKILFPTIERVKNGHCGIHSSRRLLSLSEVNHFIVFFNSYNCILDLLFFFRVITGLLVTFFCFQLWTSHNDYFSKVLNSPCDILLSTCGLLPSQATLFAIATENFR